MKLLRLALLYALAVLAQLPMLSQETIPSTALRVIRREVAYSDGFTKPWEKKLYPLQMHSGEGVQETELDEGVLGKTKSVRVHFVVEQNDASAAWDIDVLDSQSQTAWRFGSADSGERDFWSDDIVGSSVHVILRVHRAPERVRIRIDKVAVTGPEIKPESITTRQEDIVSIVGQPPEIRNVARAIVRIRFVGSDDGRRYHCTGFLVAADIVMTNEHCLSTKDEGLSALIDFDYESDKPRRPASRVVEWLHACPSLDYALVKLAAVPPGTKPLTVKTTVPKRGDLMWLIQHPLGQFKQISIVNCQISRSGVRGRGVNETDIAHLCNTLGGSSGSPLMERGSGLVLGLHHFGFVEDSGLIESSEVCTTKTATTKCAANQAVEIGKILEDIKTCCKPVYRAIVQTK
jgi:hypothetical protein